jgi:cold shock CspA family protein
MSLGSAGLRDTARYGVVTDFDDPRGLGTVQEATGASFAFHCTAIADGSRTIAVGTPVMFVVQAGHLGRFEAWGLRPLEPALHDAPTG